ncbi:mechanosensitive ion channel domain-containing protein [Pararhodonellum marinum]|uniref:mechanosensitive ion channel domain-containing protein n=1 Tax=Pararhodonellum marinum TaxID=2755358 RepID=UPI001E54A895|nr:mechanosensitive ion channel domain-containing protein [Pararhodonellum marinum]
MKTIFLKYILVLLIVSGIFPSAFGQTSEVIGNIDSLFHSIEEEQVEETQVTKPSLEGSISKVQEYNINLNRVQQKLRVELDSTEIMEVLPRAETFLTDIESRLDNASNAINLRYLSALENIISYAAYRVSRVEAQVDDRLEQLLQFRNVVDSIRRDDLMRYYLRDTTILPEYQQSLLQLHQNVNYTDSTLNSQRMRVIGYKSRIAQVNTRQTEMLDRLAQQKNVLENALFRKENNFIWEKSDFPKTENLIQVLRESLKFNLTIFFFYFNRYLNLSLMLVGFAFVFYYFLKRSLKKIRDEKEFSDIIFSRSNYVVKHPLLSSFLAVLAIAPFFFPSPPVSFFTFIMVSMVTISGFLLKTRFDSKIFRVWMALYVLFLFNAISNLYWEVAFQERWHLLGFGLLAIYLVYTIYRKSHERGSLLPQYAGTIALAFIGIQVLSFFANFLGRFSLSKLISIAATIGLMHAISLIIFVLIIKEFIYLQIEVSRKSGSEFTSYIDFDKIQSRITRTISFLAIFIWAYNFLDNISALEPVQNYISDFLEKPRNILNASFTFSQIAVFFVVIYIANLLANTLAYAATIRDEQHAAVRGKKLGSSILLIRLGIFTAGFLFAMAASGIPLDKVAIVLGALSVGIGFGLQTIVNNLVSGIILAFERPVQIGDTIQVGTIEGIVKEIGIRASKIRNWDGAEIIIPNGDLLANHLTNWTLSDKNRRVELIIGVAYKSDTELVTNLIFGQLKVEGIIDVPPPRVFLQAFGDNSVNFRVLFWVADVDTWVMIRDKVMRGIFKAFHENEIEIPFPQRDLYVKSFPGVIKENVQTGLEVAQSEEGKTGTTKKSTEKEN